MIITFVVTGTMGLLYAYGYSKTFSLYIPCAIHLGWNFTHGFIFPQGPIGNGVLIAVKPHHIVTVSYFTYFFVIFFPMASTLIINFFLLKTRKQIESPPRNQVSTISENVSGEQRKEI